MHQIPIHIRIQERRKLIVQAICKRYASLLDLDRTPDSPMSAPMSGAGARVFLDPSGKTPTSR